MKISGVIHALVGGLVVAPAISALPLADWDIVGNGTGASYTGPVPVNSTAGNVSAAPMVLVGVSDVSSTGSKKNFLGGNSWDYQGFDADDEYLAISVTPAANYTLDINAIHFAEGANNSVGASAEWQLRSSLDGFATILASEGITNGFQSTLDNQMVSLGSAFDAVTATVEFRIYGTGFSAVNGQWFIGDPIGDFTNVTIEGSVSPIPEPASLALFMASGLVLLRRR